MEKTKISFQFSPSAHTQATRNLCLSRGAPPQVLAQRSFNVLNHVTSITAEVGDKIRTMSKKRQEQALSRIASRTNFPYVACFSSMPNDLKAGSLAMIFMLDYIEKYKQGVVPSLPQWIRVSGDLRERHKIQQTNKPSLLIISNVPSNATQYKLEKVRDILEDFGDIPRIVVSTGTDPLTMFWTHLYYTLNCAVYLTDSKTWSL